MKRVELKRDFKEKAGYTLIVMQEKPYEYYEKCIRFKRSFCYPAYQEGKFVEYVQETHELTRDEANRMFLKLKKQGFVQITK
jgi:hypothetical protein